MPSTYYHPGRFWKAQSFLYKDDSVDEKSNKEIKKEKMKVLVLLCALVSTCSARRRSNLGTNENMHGDELAICSTDPMTGWVRDGTCKLYRNDYGTHTTCAELTWEFLYYSKSQGNDLMTPRSWVSDF